jgi:hypothetical protein
VTMPNSRTLVTPLIVLHCESMWVKETGVHFKLEFSN